MSSQPESPQPKLCLDSLGGSVLSVAASADGKFLAGGCLKGTVTLWDWAGAVVDRLRGHDHWVTAVAFRPDSRLLASASNDKSVKIWDLESHQVIHTLRGHEEGITGLAFHPEGRQLASTSWDGSVIVWDVVAGNERFRIQIPQGGAIAAAYSRDGRRLATASQGGGIQLWQAGDGAWVRSLPGHTKPVYSVAFHPDSGRLASCGGDGEVKVWNTVDGSEPTCLPRHAAIAFQVAFSSDGRRLASVAGDGTVRVWDLVAEREECAFPGHAALIYSVAFHPDGASLATGSRDETVRVWQLPVTPAAPLEFETTEAIDAMDVPDMVPAGDDTMVLSPEAEALLQKQASAVRAAQLDDDKTLFVKSRTFGAPAADSSAPTPGEQPGEAALEPVPEPHFVAVVAPETRTESEGLVTAAAPADSALPPEPIVVSTESTVAPPEPEGPAPVWVDEEAEPLPPDAVLERHVIFTLRGQRYSFRADDVMEVTRSGPLAPVENGDSPWRVDSGPVRDYLRRLFDLGAFLGLGAPADGKRHYVVLVRRGKEDSPHGFLVDRVLTVGDVPVQALEPHDGFPTATQPYLRGVARHQGQPLGLLDLSRVLAEGPPVSAIPETAPTELPPCGH